jgi:CheY-like chemotaxis protein
MARLVVLTQALEGLAHELGEGWTTIGRMDGNGFRIADTSVSSQHCEVRLEGDELVVRDLCSTNGTFFQGRKITEAVLKAGQTLRIGEVDLRFEATAVGRSPSASFVNTMLVGAKKTKPVPLAGNELLAAPNSNGATTKKHQVLFVDDSLAFIETFTELCSVLSNQTWEIHSATSADQALALLQRTAVDLVVLDVVMPMVDGIQVLGIIRRRHPGVRIAVLTGRATESNRTACLASGAELFIEKPVSADGCKVVFNMLNELASWEQGEGFSGILRRVGLQEVIQMECIGRRSSILEIRNHEMLGEIYIETGAITHAAVGTLAGAKAFNQLLSLSGGEFRMKPFEKPPQRTVDAPWEFLLMEAARCCDEGTDLLERNGADPTVTETTMTVIKPGPAPVAEELSTGIEHSEPEEEFVVVATYDGQWSPVNGSKD